MWRLRKSQHSLPCDDKVNLTILKIFENFVEFNELAKVDVPGIRSDQTGLFSLPRTKRDNHGSGRIQVSRFHTQKTGDPNH